MVRSFRAFAPPPFAPPAAGQHSIVLADSLSDIDTDSGGGTGRWHDILEDRYGLVRVNRTYFANGTPAATNGGDFEAGTIAGITAVANCSVAVSTTQSHSATHSVAITSTAAGTVFVAIGGGSGAVRNNFLSSTTYTVSAYVYPTGTLAASTLLDFFDNDGSGTLATGGTAATTNNSFNNRISVTRTLRAGLTEAYVYLTFTATAGGQIVYLDDVMIQRGSTLSPFATWQTRSAIAGTNLQSNDATANNAVSTFATRITPWITNGQITATDWLFVEYGQNDRNYANTSANPTPTTPARWATGVSAILTAYTALSPKPKLVWLGVPMNGSAYSATNFPAVWPSDDAIANGMDAITAPLVNAAGGLFVPLRRSMDVSLIIAAAGAHPSIAGHTYMAERVAHALEVGG